MATSATSIQRYFARLRDPRLNRRKRHLLIDIIVITLCGVICGADDFQQVAAFGRRRKDGIPSHDTLERVFDRLDPQAFQACFRQWVEALAQSLDLGHIAIDGKALRRSGKPAASKAPTAAF